MTLANHVLAPPGQISAEIFGEQTSIFHLFFFNDFKHIFKLNHIYLVCPSVQPLFLTSHNLQTVYLQAPP